MKLAPAFQAPLPTPRPRSRTAARRAPVRPLDDARTEQVRLIEFVWTAGESIQPVLLVDREWLH